MFVLSLFSANLLSPDRKLLSKSFSTPLGEENVPDANLKTTTSLSTGELNLATSEALKNIHDEMDLLVSEKEEVKVAIVLFLFLATRSQ